MKISSIALLTVLLLLLWHWQAERKGWIPKDNMMVAQEMIEKNEMPERLLFRDWNSREERVRFIRVAMAFQGTPYKMGGMTASGMDCSGFVYSVYRMFDTMLPRTTKKQFLIGRELEREELEAGDLVFFNGEKKPMHVGIYLGDGKFVHASSAAKQIRTDFIDTSWQFRHFVGAVRVRELRHPKETR